jgi:hypothetical protein
MLTMKLEDTQSTLFRPFQDYEDGFTISGSKIGRLFDAQSLLDCVVRCFVLRAICGVVSIRKQNGRHQNKNCLFAIYLHRPVSEMFVKAEGYRTFGDLNQRVSTCYEVGRDIGFKGLHVVDGHYDIYTGPTRSRLKVYCHNVTADAREYVTLHRINYAEILKLHFNGGDWHNGGYSDFQKVRLIPQVSMLSVTIEKLEY